MKRHIVIVGLFLSMFCFSSVIAQEQTQEKANQQEEQIDVETSEEPTSSADKIDAEVLFKKHCTSCHHRTQRLVGPALEGVRDRRDSAWIVNFVRNSQAMIDAGDSTAQALFMEFNQVPMPKQEFLSPDQVNAIIDYVNEPEAIVAEDDQPIARPEMPAQVQYRPLEFSSFGFWLIYTATVFMIIGWLYYMIEYTEIVKRATGDKSASEQVPFGEQD